MTLGNSYFPSGTIEIPKQTISCVCKLSIRFPKKFIVPSIGRITPYIIILLNNVVFSAPLEPTIAIIWFFFVDKFNKQWIFDLYQTQYFYFYT